MFTQIHADWWQDERGNTIHRFEVDDEYLFHCHDEGSGLLWNCEFPTLETAMEYFTCTESIS